MIQVPDYLMIKDRKLSHCLDNIILAVEHLWNYPLIQYYTDHSNKHSERIIKILEKLLRGYSLGLNDYERFILLSSAYLHDIGMQSPIHAGLDKKQKYSDDEEIKIRKQHNEASAKMIGDSLSESSLIKLGLEDCPRIARFVAQVCRYHRDLPLDDLENVSIYGERIRIPLLTSLLRLGDELDADDRRVDIAALKLREISAESKYHWWAHHYVRSVDIEDGQIILRFEFPTKYKASKLQRDLRDKIKTSLEAQYYEVYDLLYTHGLHLHKEITCTEDYIEIGLEMMPNDLEEYISKKIEQQEATKEVPRQESPDDGIEYWSSLRSLSLSTINSLKNIDSECTNPEVIHIARDAISRLSSIADQASKDKLPGLVGEVIEYLYVLLEKASKYSCYNIISTLAENLGRFGIELANKRELDEVAHVAVDRLDKSIKILGELKSFDEKSSIILKATENLGEIGEKAAENGLYRSASRCAFAFGSIGSIAIDNGFDRQELKSRIKSIVDAAERAAKTDTKMGSAIYQAGRSFNALYYYSEAEQASRKAAEIDHPQRILALLQLSNALLGQDKNHEAKTVLDEYKRLKA